MKISSFESDDIMKDDVVAVDDVSVTYSQNGDCTESSDMAQTIILTTRNNGMGRFINIKTDNWSISDVDDIITLVNDFKRRASIENEKIASKVVQNSE